MSDITVVKCGGNVAVDPDHVCADLAQQHEAGHRVVLVHGGSAEIERLSARMQVPSRRLTAPDGLSTRYTDSAMLEVVTLALAGAVKPRLVGLLASYGVTGVGLTGLDGGLLTARRKETQRAVLDGRRVLIRDNHSGRVVRVNTDLLTVLLDASFMPVVSPPALAQDGRPVNVDADRAAAAVAAALGARTLLLLTGAPGVLTDPEDESSVLSELTLPETGLPPFVSGGMGLKLVAAREALDGGVTDVVVADGRGRHPVRSALGGSGTRMLRAGTKAA
jgi:acetylglutamate/LysW-gamma-L-alpha-aminoadipate kinase